MPIGSDLNTTPPEIGNSPPVAAARIIDTLDRLTTAVEGSVPSGALDVDADIDMADQGLTNTAFLGLGNLSETDGGLAGYLFRYNNDLWFVHPDGSFQITDGLGLNAAAIGGIGGDYGSGDESVEYNATDDEYVFLDAPGDYSDLKVRAVKFMGTTTGYVRMRCDSTVDTNVEWLLQEPSTTVASTSLICQRDTGVTGPIGFTDQDFLFDGNLAMDGGYSHTEERELAMSPRTVVGTAAGIVSWGMSTTADGTVNGPKTASGSVGNAYIHDIPLIKGDQLERVLVKVSTNNATVDLVLTLYSVDDDGTATSIGTTSVSPADTLKHAYTVTVTSPVALAAARALRLRLTANEFDVTNIHQVRAQYTRP